MVLVLAALAFDLLLIGSKGRATARVRRMIKALVTDPDGGERR
ncbi:hypothetical protein APASM_6179 [Actinosynnema pretiosum subsp. pretiosum]|nr:hypothetical protein APASM_6179 [Actinosynnema pretiosum subsp. pretiosum]